MLHSSRKYTLADRLNEWVHQPIFFAALVSVGLHGVLFAALPSFSVDNSGLDDQRTVPVVELGAEEINRLPGFVELDEPLVPSINNDVYDLGLPPLDTFLNDLDTLNSADSFALDDLASLPAPVPPASSTYTPPPVLAPPTPPIVFNPIPPSPSSGWVNTPIQPAPVRPTPTPVQPTPIQPTPIQPTPIQPADPASDLDLDTGLAPDGGTEPALVAPNSTGPSGDTDSNQTNNDPANNDPSDPPVIAAQPLTNEERITKLLAEFEEKRQSVDAASGLASVTEIGQWLKTSPENLRAIELNPAFPREACGSYRQSVEGIWIGVLVGENNQIITDSAFAPNPEVLTSSGSEFFDNQAKEAVSQIIFESEELANQQASYAVTVNFTFKEEDCPSIFNELENSSDNSPPDTTDTPSADDPSVNTPSADDPSVNTPSANDAPSQSPEMTPPTDPSDESTAEVLSVPPPNDLNAPPPDASLGTSDDTGSQSLSPDNEAP